MVRHDTAESVCLVPENMTTRMKEIVMQCSAITKGHFKYASGRHGGLYVNKDRIFAKPEVLSECAKMIADVYALTTVDVVVGPAVGGALLAQWVAYHAQGNTGRAVGAAYADKSFDGYVLQRGYDSLVRGRNVLVVEDVVTTGASVSATLEAVRDAGGHCVGIMALCARAETDIVDCLGTSLQKLVYIPLTTYEPHECPLCTKGIPMSKGLGK
jgi:orotate phosphoribosyltransferase